MRVPADATIAPEKFTHYLLVPRLRADKSRYLARGGYTRENVERLIEDLRRQLLPLEATVSRSSDFGQTYVIEGPLVGPSGKQLLVRTVWLKHALSGSFHFVTLVPIASPS
jgi:hypothetical protein